MTSWQCCQGCVTARLGGGGGAQDHFFSYHLRNGFSKCNASKPLNCLNMYTPPHLFSGYGQDDGWYYGLARAMAVRLAPLSWERTLAICHLPGILPPPHFWGHLLLHWPIRLQHFFRAVRVSGGSSNWWKNHAGDEVSPKAAFLPFSPPPFMEAALQRICCEMFDDRSFPME